MADLIVEVNKLEKAFLDVVLGLGKAPCNHISCAGVLKTELNSDELSGYEQLHARGLAQQTLSCGFLQLETEFAHGLDGLANFRCVEDRSTIPHSRVYVSDQINIKVQE